MLELSQRMMRRGLIGVDPEVEAEDIADVAIVDLLDGEEEIVDIEEDLGQDLIVEDHEVGISIAEDPDPMRRTVEIREGQEVKSPEVSIGKKLKKLLTMCLYQVGLEMSKKMS